MRRILVTAFALMVLLPSVAFARSEYLCRFDGQVRSSCCCPAPAQNREAPAPAAVREASCCTVFEIAPSHAQPATEDHRGGSPLPALVARVSVHAAAAMTIAQLAAPRPRAMAPPDRGRDLFVRHCALLL